jgi:hypothetical protein
VDGRHKAGHDDGGDELSMRHNFVTWYYNKPGKAVQLA